MSDSATEYKPPPTLNSEQGQNGAYHISRHEEAERIAAEERAQRLIGKWQVFSLEDACQERPPRKYVVEGLLPRPSLSVVFGGPGSLKSMLLADLCMCAAVGKKWLESLPGDKNKGVTFVTNATPVLWIDFDNGRDGSHERFAAASKAHEIPSSHSNVRYVSMPSPWLDVSNRQLVMELAELIQAHGSGLVVIDNLGLVSGDIDENSSKMAMVMGNLRWLCEECSCAVIVVHHIRKSSGAGDNGTRKGEALRGSSSIEASLDLALYVERKERGDTVSVIPTKVRAYVEYDAFGARFAYEHKEGTKELAAARFFAEQSMSVEEAAILKIANTIKNVLLSKGPLNIQDTVTEVRDEISKEPGGKAPAINKVRGILKDLAERGEVEESDGERRERVYQCIRN